MFTLYVDNEIELHLFQPKDSNILYRLVEANREHLRKWLPWVDNMTERSHYDSLISVWQQQFIENKGINLGIFYRRKLVGSIGLHQIDWQNKFASIGYFLAKKAEGRGIITRTVQYILNYSFIFLGLNRIEIRCGVKNKKSRAIPEKLGFVLEGIIREGEKFPNHYHDLYMYSMLSRDWLQVSHQ